MECASQHHDKPQQHTGPQDRIGKFPVKNQRGRQSQKRKGTHQGHTPYAKQRPAQLRATARDEHQTAAGQIMDKARALELGERIDRHGDWPDEEGGGSDRRKAPRAT